MRIPGGGTNALVMVGVICDVVVPDAAVGVPAAVVQGHIRAGGAGTQVAAEHGDAVCAVRDEWRVARRCAVVSAGVKAVATERVAVVVLRARGVRVGAASREEACAR